MTFAPPHCATAFVWMKMKRRGTTLLPTISLKFGEARPTHTYLKGSNVTCLQLPFVPAIMRGILMTRERIVTETKSYELVQKRTSVLPRKVSPPGAFMIPSKPSDHHGACGFQQLITKSVDCQTKGKNMQDFVEPHATLEAKTNIT